MKLSLALALAPVAAFVAPVLLSVEGITKNGPLAAEIWASRPNPKQRCCAAPTRAVALRFSHRRMLRLPRMAGGDENSRVRAALPLRRGRLLSESWKPRKYHAGLRPGAAGSRRDSYLGDSARHTHAVAALEMISRAASNRPLVPHRPPRPRGPRPSRRRARPSSTASARRRPSPATASAGTPSASRSGPRTR